MRDLLLITSNVGSLFGDRSGIRNVWFERIIREVRALPAQLICINLQETGGKNYKAHSDEVIPLVDDLHKRLQRLDYHYMRAYLDTDWEKSDEYTALSSIIFLHDAALDRTAQWNFADRAFHPTNEIPMDFAETLGSGHYGRVTHQFSTNGWVRKEKFSRDFWPTFRWGRKGSLHTRWRLYGGRVVDLLNIHLFHDESNLAFLSNPSEYSDTRRKALMHVLQTAVSQEEMLTNSLFLFGDFNFRLDYRSLVKKLTRQSTESIVEDEEVLPVGARGSIEGESSGESEPPSLQNSFTALEIKAAADGNCIDEDTIGKGEAPAGEAKRALTRRRKSSVVEYRRGSVNVLRIGKKRFEFSEPQQLIENWQEYRDDDRELCNYRELRELPITFPPTYPWSEDARQPNTLMSTRGPAWCDRVLMNEKAFDDVEAESAVYRSFVQDACTGDHKPVLLAVTFKNEQTPAFAETIER